MPSPILHASINQELRELMGSDYPDLVRAWERDSHERLRALHDCHRRHRWADLRQTAHTLKGSSANLGALVVVEVCLDIEQVILEGSHDRLPLLLNTLEHAISQARSALAA